LNHHQLMDIAILAKLNSNQVITQKETMVVLPDKL